MPPAATTESEIVCARRIDRSVGVLFLAASAAVLVQAARFCFGSDLHAVAVAVQDDSYYYLVPAFLAHRHGFPTFDGVHPTYGFQPLFELFLIAWATPFDDLPSFLRAALFACHLLFALTGLLAVVVARRIAAPAGPARAALCGWTAGALLALNPSVLSGSTTLKENALFGLLLVAGLGAALAARGRPTVRRHLAVGAALGLAVACRITPSTLAVAAVVGLWACGGLRPARLAAVAAGSVAVTVPWAAWTWVSFGRFLPTSGALKSAWLRDAWADGTLFDRFAASLPVVPEYVASAFGHVFGLPHRLHVAQAALLGDPRGGPATWMIVGFAAAAVAVAALARGALPRRLPGAGLLGFAVVAAVLGTATNPVLLDGARRGELLFYAQWYVAALPVLVPVWTAVVLAGRPGARGVPSRVWWVATALLVVVGGLRCASWLQPVRPFVPHPRDPLHRTLVEYLDLAPRLPATATLGAWNAGLPGFLSGGRVVNLDGLANDAIVAARARGLAPIDAVRSVGVDHVLDYLVEDGWFGANRFDRLELLHARYGIEGPRDARVLARVSDARFPDFEPLASTPEVAVWTAVRPHPLDASRPGFRSFELRPAPGGTARLRFHCGGLAAELRAVVGGRGATLRIELDGAPAREIPAGAAAAELRLALGDANVVDLVALGVVEPGAVQPGAVPSFWVTDVAFMDRTDLPVPPAAPSGPFGSGHAREGSAMRLSLLPAADDARVLRVAVDGIPAGADVHLALDPRQASEVIDGRFRRLVGTPPAITLPVDAASTRALVELPRPDGAAGTVYAQAFASRDGRLVATSHGLRIRL